MGTEGIVNFLRIVVYSQRTRCLCSKASPLAERREPRCHNPFVHTNCILIWRIVSSEKKARLVILSREIKTLLLIHA